MTRKGVTRRTKPRVRIGFKSGLGRGPGNTFGPSPPLAGLEVRRRQSLAVDCQIRPPLTQGGITYADRTLNTPLQADGLSRRVYPFVGLAIVGLVSLHGYSAVIASPVLVAAMSLGILLVLLPLAPVRFPTQRRVLSSIPVVGGFGLALYPLWAAGSAF